MGALGVGVASRAEPYASLEPTTTGLRILLQRVPDAKSAKNRVHLDIETDDIDAEVRRLEALGARRQTPIEDWWVMLDPCENEFCVIPLQQKSEDFTATTRAWE